MKIFQSVLQWIGEITNKINGFFSEMSKSTELRDLFSEDVYNNELKFNERVLIKQYRGLLFVDGQLHISIYKKIHKSDDIEELEILKEKILLHKETIEERRNALIGTIGVSGKQRIKEVQDKIDLMLSCINNRIEKPVSFNSLFRITESELDEKLEEFKSLGFNSDNDVARLAFALEKAKCISFKLKGSWKKKPLANFLFTRLGKSVSSIAQKPYDSFDHRDKLVNSKKYERIEKIFLLPDDHSRVVSGGN